MRRRTPRITLAVACLTVGAIVGLSFGDHLHGQAVNVPPPPAIPKELTSYREVVKQVLPAVVSIEARGGKKAKDENLGSGSGVLVDPAGVIITADHVVEGAESAEVTLADGRRFSSSLIRRDSKTDLAIIRINSDAPLPFLNFSDSDSIEVGDRVLAVGAPFGLSGSVTHGIVSAKGRNNLKLNTYEDFIQTDAAVNPGNSGGPLVGLDGRIVGINSAIKSRSGGFQGVGLAISSNLARDVSQQLLRKGSVSRGYLGIGVRELDAAALKRLKIDGGVMISKVYDNTPAAKSKLKEGDVIVSIGGAAVKDAASLPQVVAKLPLNQSTELQYFRGGARYAAKIVIEEQPVDYGNERSSSQKAEPSPQTPQSPKRHLPVPRREAGEAGAGLTVTDAGVIAAVAPNSAAAEAGLARGMRIISIDGVAVTTADDVKAAFTAANREKGAVVKIQRPTGEIEFAIVRVN
jgi:serine protease Do